VLAATDENPNATGFFDYQAAQGDGVYDFYTRARDVAGNYESAPSVADTSTSKEAVSLLASDLFSRTLTSGWGSADVGGPWTIDTGSAGDFTIDGQQGAIATPSGSQGRIIYLSQASALDVDLQTKIRFAGVPSSGSYFAYALLRKDGIKHYRVGLYVKPQGALSIRGQTNTGSHLFTDVATGMTLNPGDSFVLRVQITGASPTTIKAKAWKLGTTEPSAWDVTASNNTSELQVAGTIGVRTVNTSKAATNFWFDDFLARP
jgi:hypothetical protein